MVKQFDELKSDAGKTKGIADDSTGKKEYPSECSLSLYAEYALIPAIIGELGVPFDMKKTSLRGLARGGDQGEAYEQSAKVCLEPADGGCADISGDG